MGRRIAFTWDTGRLLDKKVCIRTEQTTLEPALRAFSLGAGFSHLVFWQKPWAGIGRSEPMLKSLRTKVMFNFGLFLVLIIGIFFLTYISIDRQNDEIRLMNLASEQQMLIQRLAKDALLVLQGDPNAIPSLLATQQEIDKALTILENGDEELDIQAITDPVALERFEQLKTEWAAFSPNIDIVTARVLGNTSQAIRDIAADSETFVATMNSVVEACAKVPSRESISRFGSRRCCWRLGSVWSLSAGS